MRSREALGNVAMSIMKTMSRFLRRRNAAADHSGSGGASKISSAEAEEFTAKRRARLEAWTDSDIDKMTHAALSRADKDQTLREAHSLREKRQRRTGQSVRRHPE